MAAAPTRSALVRYSARWGSRRGVLGTGLQRNSSTHDFVFVLSFKQLWQSISISTNIRVSLPIFYLCCQSESENPGLGQGEDLKDVPGCPGVQIRSITVATDSNAGAPPCSIAAAELAAPSPGSPPPPRTLREDALAAAADVARPSSIGRDAGSLGYHLGVLAEASAAGGEPVPCAAGRSGTHPPPYAMLSAATAPPEACGGGHTPYQRRLLSERAVAAMVLQGNGAPLGGDALARLCDAAARGPAAASALAAAISARPDEVAPRLDLVWAALAGAFAADDRRLRAGAFAVVRAAACCHELVSARRLQNTATGASDESSVSSVGHEAPRGFGRKSLLFKGLARPMIAAVGARSSTAALAAGCALGVLTLLQGLSEAAAAAERRAQTMAFEAASEAVVLDALVAVAGLLERPSSAPPEALQLASALARREPIASCGASCVPSLAGAAVAVLTMHAEGVASAADAAARRASKIPAPPTPDARRRREAACRLLNALVDVHGGGTAALGPAAGDVTAALEAACYDPCRAVRSAATAARNVLEFGRDGPPATTPVPFQSLLEATPGSHPNAGSMRVHSHALALTYSSSPAMAGLTPPRGGRLGLGRQGGAVAGVGQPAWPAARWTPARQAAAASARGALGPRLTGSQDRRRRQTPSGIRPPTPRSALAFGAGGEATELNEGALVQTQNAKATPPMAIVVESVLSPSVAARSFRSFCIAEADNDQGGGPQVRHYIMLPSWARPNFTATNIRVYPTFRTTQKMKCESPKFEVASLFDELLN